MLLDSSVDNIYDGLNINGSLWSKVIIPLIQSVVVEQFIINTSSKL